MMVFVSVLLLSLASSIHAQSTLLSTMTLADVVKRPDANAPKIANGMVQTTSRALSPAGTAADGSTTTYSEQEVEYQMTVLGGVTSTVSSTTRNGMRIQSLNGYVRIQTLPFEGGAMSSVQSCSYGGGIRPGCVEVVGVEYLQTKEYRLATSTITSIQTLSTSATTNTLGAGDATIVQQELLVTSVATQAVDAPPVGSTTAAPIATSTPTYTPPVNGTAVDQHTEGGSQKSSILGPAIGGAVGGVLVILILIALWALLRRKNREKTEAKARARLSDPEFAPQFKYHYRQSRMVTHSTAGSWKEEMEKGGITINFDADSLYNVTTPHSPSPKTTAYSI